uniref:Uncharacterized protein n=1 Tax=viral metagenome TaxID=1070528 RepID=A0A6C0I4J7_9ZZZZ
MIGKKRSLNFQKEKKEYNDETLENNFYIEGDYINYDA